MVLQEVARHVECHPGVVECHLSAVFSTSVELKAVQRKHEDGKGFDLQLIVGGVDMERGRGTGMGMGWGRGW